MTNVPTAGDPYTLWFVVFNNPSASGLDGCNGADIPNLAVGGSASNVSGAVSADNGRGGDVINIDFEVVAGKLPGDLFILGGDPKGLFRNNGFKAEVHLVVDRHPSIAPGAMTWIPDLATTVPPGGANTRAAVAVFAPCPDASCPDSVL